MGGTVLIELGVIFKKGEAAAKSGRDMGMMLGRK